LHHYPHYQHIYTYDLLHYCDHDIHGFKNDHNSNDSDDILYRDDYRPGEHHHYGNPDQYCVHNGDLLYDDYSHGYHHRNSDNHNPNFYNFNHNDSGNVDYGNFAGS
jgi:hypothetical protein